MEKILKVDGAPEMYVVSSVRREFPVKPGTCSKEKRKEKKKTLMKMHVVRRDCVFLHGAVVK